MDVRWGIIGCGDVVERKSGLAFDKVKRSQLTAVMRRDAEKAKDFARRHGVGKYYSSVEALLRDDEINAIYVATPPYLHCEHTVKAAQSGKHVLCEKPMALTVRECEEMIRACEKNKVQLMVAYYRRFFPVVRRIKKLLEERMIGEPVIARVEVLAPYEPPAEGSSAWRLDPQMAGGGFLTDFGCHFLDLLIHLLGDVGNVAAFVDTLHSNFRVDDASCLIMRLKSGIHALASFDWNVNPQIEKVEIVGSKGRILSTNLTTSGELKLLTDQESESYCLPAPDLPLTRVSMVEHFVNSIITGRRNCLPGEEGLKTVRVVQAAYRSSKERKTITIS